MAVRQREYLFAVDKLSHPLKVEGKEAIGTLLVRLILLNPGSDPLKPEMGVGIENYRFALNRLDELRERIQDQIRTYLPDFSNAEVEIVEITSKKVCNIEITVDDVTYVYDSTVAPVPISLTDVTNG